MCELLSFAIWIVTPCCFLTFGHWGCSSFTTTSGPCAGIKSQVFLMSNGGYFILEPSLSNVNFICTLLHNPRRRSTKGPTLSGLVTRSTYCRARHRTQESSLEKALEWGIEHPLVCPRTRKKRPDIHNEWHTIKFPFTHIPTGCNSCVENELLHVVLARGMERWRGGYTYGGRDGLARVACNVLHSQDALHAQKKP